MKLSTKEIIICGLFAAITSILSQISIPLPFTTVPLTMQVFAVAISGIILGAKKGFISQTIYILMGAIGIPVFAEMTAGIGIVIGPTGGFILGFPLMSLIIGYFTEKFKKNTYIGIGMLLGLIIDYIIGTIMFSFITKVTFIQGIIVCVVPFILADLIKLSLAIFLGISISKRINKGIK
ncbi:MAG: biotin transporter BioY [Romboutsia sp.]